jgi:hypothetical protein
LQDDYFRVGDVDDLAKNIVYKISLNKERDYREILIRNFNWDNIALETVNIYKNLFAKDAINTGKNRLR